MVMKLVRSPSNLLILLILLVALWNMASSSDDYPSASSCANGDTACTTTNAQDQREAQKLKDRLKASNQHAAVGGVGGDAGSARSRLTSVKIAEGRHKYVLIKAEYVPRPSSSISTPDGGGKRSTVVTSTQYFVTSKRGASYHRNAAEPMIAEIERAGCYQDIDIVGGGRIDLDEDAKKIAVFGFSYSFGQANHAISRQVILEDPRYKDYDVTISNEGY
jgi:phosphohistidine phosphatase